VLGLAPAADGEFPGGDQQRDHGDDPDGAGSIVKAVRAARVSVTLFDRPGGPLGSRCASCASTWWMIAIWEGGAAIDNPTGAASIGLAPAVVAIPPRASIAAAITPAVRVS